MVHLAARAGVRPSIADPELYVSVNLQGTACLLEACRRHAVGRFVFGSSSSVYGNNVKVPFAEADRVDHPVSPYAATKKAGELLCYAFHHLTGTPVACLRFFTVYGPRQRPEMAIHKFTRLLAAGEEIEQFGDGSSARDYTFVVGHRRGDRRGAFPVQRLSRVEPRRVANDHPPGTRRTDRARPGRDAASQGASRPARGRRADVGRRVPGARGTGLGARRRTRPGARTISGVVPPPAGGAESLRRMP